MPRVPGAKPLPEYKSTADKSNDCCKRKDASYCGVNAGFRGTPKRVDTNADALVSCFRKVALHSDQELCECEEDTFSSHTVPAIQIPKYPNRTLNGLDEA